MYKGENLLAMGTAKELAKFKGVQEKTIKFYLTPTYKKRIENRKTAKDYITLVALDTDDL